MRDEIWCKKGDERRKKELEVLESLKGRYVDGLMGSIILDDRY